MNIQFSPSSSYSAFAPNEGKPGLYSMLASDARVERANSNFMDSFNNPDGVNGPIRYQQFSAVSAENRGDNFAVRPADNTNSLSEARKSASNEMLQTANRISASYPSAEDRLIASVNNNPNNSTANNTNTNTTNNNANTDVLQVTNINSAATGNTNISVSVSQTASAQENSGRFFAQGGSDFNEGNNSINIKTNQGDFNININVREGETNQSVINRTAETINRRDIGVTASTDNNSSGAVSLNIQANKTGTANAFEVEQSPFTNRLDVAQPSTEARNAEYSVNGGEQQSSSSNNVFIGNGITANLINEGDAQVTVSQSHRNSDIGAEDQSRTAERENNRIGSGSRFFDVAA